MKRSEMNQIVYQRIKEDLMMRSHSDETDEAYWMRKSRWLIDLLLDYGMLPPPRMRYTDVGEEGNTLCSEECTWEEEE